MKAITITIAGTTSAQTFYVPAPVRCVATGMKLAVGSAVGSSKAFIVGKGTTAQLTATTTGTPSAGDVFSAAVNASDIFEATDSMKITVPELGVAGPVVMTIFYDPFLSGASGA